MHLDRERALFDIFYSAVQTSIFVFASRQLKHTGDNLFNTGTNALAVLLLSFSKIDAVW